MRLSGSGRSARRGCEKRSDKNGRVTLDRSEAETQSRSQEHRGRVCPAPHAVHGGAHRTVVGIAHAKQVSDEVGAGQNRQGEYCGSQDSCPKGSTEQAVRRKLPRWSNVMQLINISIASVTHGTPGRHRGGEARGGRRETDEPVGPGG
jgi:hypothetical protein